MISLRDKIKAKLDELPPNPEEFLSLGSIAKLVGCTQDGRLLQALTHLCSRGELRLHFMVADSRGDLHELSDNEAAECISSDTVIDPISGEALQGAEERMYPVFRRPNQEQPR